MEKQWATVGCCGIDCGLCPRFYTAGSSRCPGCGGAGFADKHPPCGIRTCCIEKHAREICALCDAFPCARFADREAVERDSFVTHKRIFRNHAQVREEGFDAFIAEHNARMALLNRMLADYDDGRSKSLFCFAAALLNMESIETALTKTADEPDRKRKAEALKAVLLHRADEQGVCLKPYR